MLRIQVEVTRVERVTDKDGTGHWEVWGKDSTTGKSVYMSTTRSGYCAKQLIYLTCESISPDGEILGGRLKSRLPFLYTRKGDKEIQLTILTEYLSDLKKASGLGKSSGKVQVEKGFDISIDRRGWFLVFRKDKKVMSCCHAAQLAKMLVEDQIP